MKENILVFDVESTSLLGNGFCFGAIVSDKEGKILDKKSMLSIESLDSCSDWVKENVLPNLDDITKVKTDILLREEFYKFYIKWKDTSDIWVDCGFPVETNFLNKVALDDLKNREFNMPYLLYDLCNFVHPDIERENKGKKHNPIDDSIASLKYIIDGKFEMVRFYKPTVRQVCNAAYYDIPNEILSYFKSFDHKLLQEVLSDLEDELNKEEPSTSKLMAYADDIAVISDEENLNIDVSKVNILYNSIYDLVSKL